MNDGYLRLGIPENYPLPEIGSEYYYHDATYEVIDIEKPEGLTLNRHRTDIIAEGLIGDVPLEVTTITKVPQFYLVLRANS